MLRHDEGGKRVAGRAWAWAPTAGELERIRRFEAAKQLYVCTDCGTRFRAAGPCCCPYCGMFEPVKVESESETAKDNESAQVDQDEGERKASVEGDVGRASDRDDREADGWDLAGWFLDLSPAW